MKRVEHYFERLTKRQRVTVAMIVTQFEKGCHEIDSEIEAETAQENQVEKDTTGQAPQDAAKRIETSATYGKPEPQVIEPDEIIPANQDEIGDGSGTGD